MSKILLHSIFVSGWYPLASLPIFLVLLIVAAMLYNTSPALTWAALAIPLELNGAAL